MNQHLDFKNCSKSREVPYSIKLFSLALLAYEKTLRGVQMILVSDTLITFSQMYLNVSFTLRKLLNFIIKRIFFVKQQDYILYIA